MQPLDRRKRQPSDLPLDPDSGPAARQPLNSGIQSQPNIGVHSQSKNAQPERKQPLNGAKSRPRSVARMQPERSQPLKAKRQPPKVVLPPAQPARKQPLKLGVQSQPRPRGQPPDVQAPDLPPDPKTSVRKEDWGKGSIDPG